jgi:hypothetical protein
MIAARRLRAATLQNDHREDTMHLRCAIGAAAVIAALATMTGVAAVAEQAKYPDLRGQWRRTDPGNRLRIGLAFDSSKAIGRGEEAPMTPEYQAIFEANLADQATGGQGTDPTFTCLAPGMPRVMIAYGPMEVVVTPETDGDGGFDTLVVETRGLKGPRAYDASGIPLHQDNQTVIKERIFLDKADGNLLHDEITTFDHALTHPWVVMKSYRRVVAKDPIWWREDVCAEGNNHVGIAGENYFLSGDGLLMPAKKDQPPPDLRYFKSTRK